MPMLISHCSDEKILHHDCDVLGKLFTNAAINDVVSQ